MEKLDFYLEGLTESSYNTKFIKTKREIHTNICFHVRENSTQLFYEYKIDKITVEWDMIFQIPQVQFQNY